MKIAFDVDDTIIVPAVATNMPSDTPNYPLIAVYKWFQGQGHDMIVWSGGGVDYATRWAEKLGLYPCTILVKEKRHDVDIAFDDCLVDLGTINIQVKRYNNSISRKDWNKHDKPQICVSCKEPMKEVYDEIASRYTGHLWRCDKCMKNPEMILSVG